MRYDAFTMKTLTIRNVPKRLADALEREKRRRGRSLNQTVLDVLNGGLGVGTSGGRRNGLAHLAGTWSADDHEAFEAAVASTEQIDDELWR
jgi:hypothetical protein